MNERRPDPDLVEMTEPIDPERLSPEPTEPRPDWRDIPAGEDVNPDAAAHEPPD
jgi:hypothetical protein